ncbi:hypothetical protein [Sphingomonas solaris]|uniref:Glycosyltransferase family 4 protein n=1 Tax=Alterirhizorhabdus solaris TaxID=2529389 RepID=A0A558QYD5_9SPHN|nr:hypothetical protein [Sphingomonas solaris]TVV72098.1 hypothetical protein FOY91_15340 [Sphingomonas solaris]
MRICIVIQSDAFRESAGMRIRYDRFRDCLTDPEVTIEAITCAVLIATPKLDHDVYIFCKTFDVGALVLARRIHAAGKVVGQDLFDDYFSQYADSRLERFREWMRDMAPVTRFALCSTPRMVEAVRPYLPGIRIEPVDDPVIGYDPLMVAALAEAKVRRAHESRLIEIAWFGIGDNPYFPVGIADLIACEADLARIERQGWTVRLRIVTNTRPFDGIGAEVLRGLSVAHEFVEWTEQAEREVLTRATVALVPVNGQSFSRAKSMNRAVTALNGGCQVLNIGYPLYDRLDAFLYRDVDTLLADMTAGHCRVRSETMTALTQELWAMANPFESAARFVRQARLALSAPPPPVQGPLCLVHGQNSVMAYHKATMALRGISVATMFTRAGWNFNMRFDVVAGEVRVRLATALASRFMPPLLPGDPIRIGDLDFLELDLAALGVPAFPVPAVQDPGCHARMVDYVDRCCRAAFGPIDLLASDTLPARQALRTVRAAA